MVIREIIDDAKTRKSLKKYGLYSKTLCNGTPAKCLVQVQNDRAQAMSCIFKKQPIPYDVAKRLLDYKRKHNPSLIDKLVIGKRKAHL